MPQEKGQKNIGQNARKNAGKKQGNKQDLVQRISRDRRKFVKNLEHYLDREDDKKKSKNDVWSFLIPAKRQKTIEQVFLHLPKDQQVNILISYLTSSPKNVGTLIPSIKASVLREIAASASASAAASSVSVPGKPQQKKRRNDIYETLEGGKTLGNLGDLNTFFFNGKDHGNADATQNSFMEGFLRAHHNEKNGIKPSVPSQQNRKNNVSIIRLSSNKKSVPGISLSILSPSLASKSLLDQYMISSVSDFKTWKSIVKSAAPSKLIEDIQSLVTIGKFPSESSYKDRLESLAKTAFVSPPPINSKDVSEKCIVLENEMKIAQKNMATSFEFCLTVYVLYKLLNLNPPRVKIL